MLCPRTMRMDSRWGTNLGRAYAPLPNRRDKGIVAVRHSLDIVESMNAPAGQPLYSHWSIFWCHHLNFDDTFKWKNKSDLNFIGEKNAHKFQHALITAAEPRTANLIRGSIQQSQLLLLLQLLSVEYGQFIC